MANGFNRHFRHEYSGSYERSPYLFYRQHYGYIHPCVVPEVIVITLTMVLRRRRRSNAIVLMALPARTCLYGLASRKLHYHLKKTQFHFPRFTCSYHNSYLSSLELPSIIHSGKFQFVLNVCCSRLVHFPLPVDRLALRCQKYM